ncbi:MAG: ATP-binding cassette domain-containing protein [Phycisphaerae bacterium]
MNQTDTPIIELRHIHKSFGHLVVLQGLDLKIERGKTTVILGESGTGKSVLLKIIVRLLRPDQGRIIFEGRDITSLSERRLAEVRMKFGFLFQGGALFDSMTAEENVAFPLREHTASDEDKIKELTQEKLKLVGLEQFGSRMPGQLSGGQKKRIALARAIALAPQVILYDEPTTGLDPIRADVIDELILKLKEHLKVTSIVVTHDMKSAFKVADRILMLYHGNFIFDGTAEEIRQSKDQQVQRFITGQADAKELEALDIS